MVKSWFKLESSKCLMCHRGLESLIAFNCSLVLAELARSINIDFLKLQELLEFSVHSVHSLLSPINYGLK